MTNPASKDAASDERRPYAEIAAERASATIADATAAHAAGKYLLLDPTVLTPQIAMAHQRISASRDAREAMKFTKGHWHELGAIVSLTATHLATNVAAHCDKLEARIAALEKEVAELKARG